MEDTLKHITETIEGHSVKNLKWNPIDNIIVGQVKCPTLGNEKLHEGFIAVQWKCNGKPTNKYKGCNWLEINTKL